MCALWEDPDEDDPDDNACHVSPQDACHVFSEGGVPTHNTFMRIVKVILVVVFYDTSHNIKTFLILINC